MKNHALSAASRNGGAFMETNSTLVSSFGSVVAYTFNLLFVESGCDLWLLLLKKVGVAV